MFHSIDTKILFSHLRNSFDFVVAEMEDIVSDHLIEKVILRLKGELCKYFKNELSNSLPQIEKKADVLVDELLPCHSEPIENIVNDIVNRMIEEIVKEIESYLVDKENKQ
jgi:hypothetical protein